MKVGTAFRAPYTCGERHTWLVRTATTFSQFLRDLAPWSAGRESKCFVLWLDVVGMSRRNTNDGVSAGDADLAKVTAALTELPDTARVSPRESDEWLVAFIADPTVAVEQGSALLTRIANSSGIRLHGALTDLAGTRTGERVATYPATG